MSDYRIVMDTNPKPHEGARTAVCKDSVKDVLKELRINLMLSVGLLPLNGECKIHHTGGVWYDKGLYLGRRTLLSFTASSDLAKRITGYNFPDGTTLCICAAHPTAGAHCTSKDFFVCVWDTQEDFKDKRVHIYSVFRREITQDGSSVILGFWEPKYLYDLAHYLANEYNCAREAAKEARL